MKLLLTLVLVLALGGCGPHLCKSLDIVLDDGLSPKTTRATLVCNGLPIVEAEVDVLGLPFSSQCDPCDPCACEVKP